MAGGINNNMRDFITALADWRRRVRDFRADDGSGASGGAIAGGDGLFRV